MRSLIGWNQLEKRKRVLLTILAVVVLVRLGYIWIGGEVDREYRLSGEVDLTDAVLVPCTDITQTFSATHDRLHTLEFLFTGIAPDQAGHIRMEIFSGDRSLYLANLALSKITDGQWKHVYVGLALEEGLEYQIHLNASEDCTQIPNLFMVRPDQGAPEAIASAHDGQPLDGITAIRFGYLEPPGILDLLTASALWLLALLLFSFLIYYSTALAAWGRGALDCLYRKVDRRAVALLAELSACYIILYSSGIPFQDPTKLIFYVLSVCVMAGGDRRRDFLRDLCDKPWKRGLVIFLDFYAAFALVGQRIFIYPLDRDITAVGLLVFAVALFWVVPVVRALLYTFHWLTKHALSEKHRQKRTWVFITVVLLLLLVPAAICLYAFNPGISSSDTLHCMVSKAHHLYGTDDWHPASYAIILRILQKIWDSTYMVIFAQWFFWAYVMLELLLYLRKKGIRDEFLYGTALFSSLNAANALHLNTIWKDIPYAFSLLWALVCVAKLTIDRDEYRKKWYIYLELTTALSGLVLYRKNGIVPFILVIVVLTVTLRRNPRVWSALAAAVMVVCVVRGPVYDYLAVKNDAETSARGGKYIGLGQDILGVYYSGGQVSSQTLQMINVLTDYNNDFSYVPTTAASTYNLDVEPLEFIKEYLCTFICNPVLMSRAIIDRGDSLWDIFTGEGCIVSNVNVYYSIEEYYPDSQWNDYYPARHYTSLYPRVVAATTYTASSEWISAIEWRCGLFTLLGLTACIFLLLKRGLGRYAAIITPIVGQILSLLLSTGWACFRYYWPINLMNMALCLLVPVIAAQRDGTSMEEVCHETGNL